MVITPLPDAFLKSGTTHRKKNVFYLNFHESLVRLYELHAHHVLHAVVVNVLVLLLLLVQAFI